MNCNICGSFYPRFDCNDMILWPEGMDKGYVCPECNKAGRKVCMVCGNTVHEPYPDTDEIQRVWWTTCSICKGRIN